MRLGSLFTGYGGLDEAVRSVLGGELTWVSEIDPGARKILAARYPGVPNLGDITRIDWASVPGVDVLTGGFPCQDVSHAGARAGLGPDTRSGLWSRMAEAIDKLRPRLVVAENVRGLLSASADSDVEPCPWCMGEAGDARAPLRALGAVLADLAELGFDAEWVGLRAADVGAAHGRPRVFVLAWPASDATRDGSVRGGAPRGRGAGPAHDRRADADTPSDGRHQGRPEPAWVRRGSDAPERRAPADADPNREGRRRFPQLDGEADEPRQEGPYRGHVDGLALEDRGPWGLYRAAIDRWARIVGRDAPSPTDIGRNGQPRLSPVFVEWLMGVEEGWVTAVPGLSRNDQLKALGNGVVPQQAAAAVAHLLGRMEWQVPA